MEKIIRIENYDKQVWDSKYPKFRPAKYITILTSGYLNGGYHIKAGMIMKMVDTNCDFAGGYDYQGFYEQDMVKHGNTNLEEICIRRKAISSTDQYLRIEGTWFRASTQSEIDIFEGWLKEIREANQELINK